MPRHPIDPNFYPCTHPRTVKNTYTIKRKQGTAKICATCHKERNKRYRRSPKIHIEEEEL